MHRSRIGFHTIEETITAAADEEMSSSIYRQQTRLVAHPQQLAVGQDDIARSDDASDEECAGDCHRDNVANETSQKQSADEELLPLPEPLKMTVPVGVKRSRNQVVCSEPQEAHQLSNLECGVSETKVSVHAMQLETI